MAAAALPSDRLSDLPDGLIIHILSFAPGHEAARTTALSRRWRRHLWRETAAANLDYSSCSGIYDKALFCAYLRRRVIRKMNVTMRDRDITDADLSPVGDDGIEELRLECQDGGCPRYTYAGPSPESLWFDLNLSLDWLPWESLRVLELTGCNLPLFPPEEVPEWDYLRYSYMPWHEEPEQQQQQQDIEYDSPPPHIAFPCLEALRLRRCAMYVDTLQTFIDGAPRLTNLCLESISVLQHCTGQLQIGFHLRCPTVAVLDMANLHVHDGMAMSGICGCHVKLDAPGLRTLRYTQSMCSDTAISFESPMPHLERVYLATHSAWSAPLRRSFLAPNVSRIRFLKLTAYSMADLADDDGDESPMLFSNLERLEVEELTPCGCPASCHTAAAALMNLLRGCPVLRELRLKFRWLDYLRETVQDPVIQAAVVSDFTSCRSINSGDDEDCCDGLDLLPVLNHRCRLDCLRSSLRRVVLEFDTEELSAASRSSFSSSWHATPWLPRRLSSMAERDTTRVVSTGRWPDGARIAVIWLGKKVINVCATIVTRLMGCYRRRLCHCQRLPLYCGDVPAPGGISDDPAMFKWRSCIATYFDLWEDARTQRVMPGNSGQIIWQTFLRNMLQGTNKCTQC